jgi:hypothetical protein
MMTARQRRATRELVWRNGSFHGWLEEREPRGCLMHMVDDATTTALSWFAADVW